MLRSLVGSEMCIRDSLSKGFESLQKQLADPGFRVQLKQAIVSPTNLESCLLYASDAADALLCLDLGGRRLIKKKKKNHIQ